MRNIIHHPAAARLARLLAGLCRPAVAAYRDEFGTRPPRTPAAPEPPAPVPTPPMGRVSLPVLACVGLPVLPAAVAVEKPKRVRKPAAKKATTTRRKK